MVECSSYQIDLSPSIDPSVGILLNLTPDHIDRHGTFARYAAVKETARGPVAGPRSWRSTTSTAPRSLIGSRSPWLERSFRVSTTERLADGYFLEGTAQMRAVAGGAVRSPILPASRRFAARHNAQNALAAIAALEAAGLAPEENRSRAQELPRPGAPGMELVARRGNVLFVNDSKATNAGGRRACSVDLRAHLLDCRRPAKGGRQSSRCGPLVRADRQGLSHRRGGAGLCPRCSVQPFLMRFPARIRSAVENAAADSAGDASLESVVLLSLRLREASTSSGTSRYGADAFREAVGDLDHVETIGRKD